MYCNLYRFTAEATCHLNWPLTLRCYLNTALSGINIFRQVATDSVSISMRHTTAITKKLKGLKTTRGQLQLQHLIVTLESDLPLSLTGLCRQCVLSTAQLAGPASFLCPALTATACRLRRRGASVFFCHFFRFQVCICRGTKVSRSNGLKPDELWEVLAFPAYLHRLMTSARLGIGPCQ